MNLRIARWGNSLALRIPSGMARRFNLHHRDTVDARITLDAALSIRLANWSRAAFAAEIDSAREAIPPRPSATDELRGKARY